jgi:hypothetical protein
MENKIFDPNYFTNNCLSNVTLASGTKHVSRLANLQTERKKLEKLEESALTRLKENIPSICWNNNLRNPMSLKGIFDRKFV